MDYNHIKDFLEKIRTTIFSKEENIQIVSNIIEKNISIKIETKYIQIKPPFIYIKTSPLIRNEIMINKNKIINEISSIVPNLNIKDLK